MISKVSTILKLSLLAGIVGVGCTHGSRSDDDVRDVAPVASPKPTAKVKATPNAGTRADRNSVVKNDASAAADDLNVDVDNSKVNSVKGKTEDLTAEDQSNSENDVEITRKIRRSLTEDGSLSVYAHNVKIITQGGRVTLKGPVRSAAEKETIEKRARQFAGATAVTNEITITEN